jgi:peptidoglycan pentaglycine glycine transferase (the first glycine)
MRAVESLDAQAWDAALHALPNPHVLQSWAWGEFKARHGWRATRLLFQEGEEVVAAASVLQRRLPGRVTSILYTPKALFIKIDPDVYYPEDVPPYSPRPSCAPEVARLLEGRGWRTSGDQIQFRNTVLLDLDRPAEEILAAMKQKTRYNVRLARRRGVTVREGGLFDLDLFYRLYAETAERDSFLIRQPGYYLDAWATFLESGQAHLLLAGAEGEMVAGLMLFTFGPVAWYMYGASSDRHRRHMPNQLIQWEAIRRAKASGCTLYDLWGAPDSGGTGHWDESDPMWGVARFKLGLGGQLARGLGAWDYPVSRPAYWLYTVAMPRYLGLLRARHPTGQA